MTDQRLLAICVINLRSCSCETALVLSIVMMSRMSLTGHVFIGLGDAVVGLLLGLGALSVTGGTFLPLVQALLGKGTARKAAAGLMAMAALVAVGCSVGGVFPYTGAHLVLIAAMIQAAAAPVKERCIVELGQHLVYLGCWRRRIHQAEPCPCVCNCAMRVYPDILLTVRADCCCMLQPPCPSA